MRKSNKVECYWKKSKPQSMVHSYKRYVVEFQCWTMNYSNEYASIQPKTLRPEFSSECCGKTEDKINSFKIKSFNCNCKGLNVSVFAHSAKSKRKVFVASNLGILPKRTGRFLHFNIIRLEQVKCWTERVTTALPSWGCAHGWQHFRAELYYPHVLKSKFCDHEVLVNNYLISYYSNPAYRFYSILRRWRQNCHFFISNQMNSIAGLLFSVAELLVRPTHQELEFPIGKVG